METVQKQTNRPIMMAAPLFDLDYPPCWEEQYVKILTRQERELYEIYHWYAVMHAVAQPTSQALRAELGVNSRYFRYANEELVCLGLIELSPRKHIRRVRVHQPKELPAELVAEYLAAQSKRVTVPETAASERGIAIGTQSGRNMDTATSSTTYLRVNENTKCSRDEVSILSRAQNSLGACAQDEDGSPVRYTGYDQDEVVPPRRTLSDADVAALRSAQSGVPPSARLSRQRTQRVAASDAGQNKRLPRSVKALLTDYYAARHLAAFGVPHASNRSSDGLHLYGLITDLTRTINLGRPDGPLQLEFALACIDVFFTAIKSDPKISSPINADGWKPVWLHRKYRVCLEFLVEHTVVYLKYHQTDPSLRYLRVDQSEDTRSNYIRLRKRFNTIDGRFVVAVSGC